MLTAITDSRKVMDTSIRRLAVVASVLLVISGCGRRQTELVTFDLKGTVLSIDTVKHRITIDHEEIPNYMPKMIMAFRVKDTSLLSKVQPGDTVEGTLAVSRTESWLETLSVVGKGKPPDRASADDILFRRLYRIGERLPDFSFYNQDGKRVRLSDFRGQAVAITFIYTRCPLPDFCIRMSDHFSRVQKSLSKDAAVKNRWHLITISFDPAFDTPEVLRRYGRTYGADFSTWDFVSDGMSTVREIADGLELSQANDEGGLIAHNLRTAVIDPEGVLVEVYKGNEWTPRELEEKIREAMRKNS